MLIFDFPFNSVCIIRGRILTEICHLSHEKQLITMNTQQPKQNDTQIAAPGRRKGGRGKKRHMKTKHPSRAKWVLIHSERAKAFSLPKLPLITDTQSWSIMREAREIRRKTGAEELCIYYEVKAQSVPFEAGSERQRVTQRTE